MDPLSHLIVIPCPNGFTSTGAYRYSVYLSPRLRESGTLDDYPTWRNWGDRVANLRFRLFNGNTPTGAAVTVVSDPVDPTVWQSVFGTNSSQWSRVDVTPFAFVDRTDSEIFTFGSSELGNKIESIYGRLAADGDRLDDAAVTSALEAADLGPTVTDGEAWFGPIGNDKEPTAPENEFHQSLRYLASHPDLMRRLGLVFDIEVTLPPGAAPNEMQVRTNFPNLPVAGGPNNTFDSREQVPCRMQIDSDNLPVVRLPDYRVGRWVNFAKDKFTVQQGAANNQLSALASLQRQVGAGDSSEPPAVEDGGLYVANVGVEEMLLDQFEHSAEVNDDTDRWLRYEFDPVTGVRTLPPKVYAEDVAIGVRWDVADTSKGTFRSLHERSAPGGYKFPRTPTLDIVPLDSEGWSSLAISTDGTAIYERSENGAYPNGEEPPVKRYVDRDLTKWRADGSALMWDGWSLSAQRPMLPIDSRGLPGERGDNLPLSTDPAQVAVNYRAVPGTLERLRFEHTYRFRGRCVDLCGNSEPVTATAPRPQISQPVTFGRMMPVPSPTVVRRSSRPVPGVGDHATTIVIKSELDEMDRDTAPADRMLFPPRVNQLRLEHHGLPDSDGIDIADYQFIADRDARVLANQLLADPVTGESVAGDAIIGESVTQGVEKQPALYMPDPATNGIAFHDLPKGRAGTSLVMKTGNWPDPESVVLELTAGNRLPRTMVSKRKVQVSLPKGTVAECSTSAAIDRNWINHFRFFNSLRRNLKERSAEPIINGQNTAYSPRRAITLVHAVRIPLLSPSLQPFTASRGAIGDTVTTVNGSIELHRATTDRVVVPCTWNGPDLRSDPSGLTIGQVGSAIMIDDPIALPERPSDELIATFDDVTLDLLDTQRHNVTLTAESFCRFSEYFTERVAAVAEVGTPILVDERGFDPVSVSITNQVGTNIPFTSEYFTTNAAAGMITPLTVPGGPQGKIDIDYIPLPISRLSDESISGKTTTFTVASSAPPPPPNVVRVLPAFSRTVRSTNSKIMIEHDGRVIRAHMTAPWNASGEGEQVGVALETDGSFSQWGRDATVVAAGTLVAPTMSRFKKAISRVNNVDGGFDMAGHDVAYDAERDLVTSDIQVNATFAYRPFVQLHLCRYQPVAINGAHVSTTVPTDVMRLGAQRRVTVQKQGNDRVRVQLVGADNVNQVTVRVEDADPTISDDPLKWQDIDTPVVLNRTGTRRSARFSGLVPLSASAGRRIVIEDAEPVQRQTDTGLVTEYEVAYREVVEIPENW